MKEINEKQFKAIEKGEQCTFEKLIALVIKPSTNSYAELFKDVAIGVFFCVLSIVLLAGALK